MTPENGNRDSSNAPRPEQDSRDACHEALERQREADPAEPSTGSAERNDIGNASRRARRTLPATPSDPPPRLPVRALGEYVLGGRVDAMRRLLRGG